MQATEWLYVYEYMYICKWVYTHFNLSFTELKKNAASRFFALHFAFHMWIPPHSIWFPEPFRSNF